MSGSSSVTLVIQAQSSSSLHIMFQMETKKTEGRMWCQENTEKKT